MATKANKGFDENYFDITCRAIEFCILPGFVLLSFIDLKFALCSAGIAGLCVSAWKLLKEYLKLNK